MRDDPALQCCNSVVTIRNNVATILQQVATLCCAKNLHYESSRVTPYRMTHFKLQDVRPDLVTSSFLFL